MRLSNIFSIYIISDCNTIHWNITNRVANVIYPHDFLNFFIDLKFAQVPENVRIAVRSKMWKKYNIVVILKFIREWKSICFFEFIFEVFNITGIKAHIQSFPTGSYSQVIIIIFNVESFSVPLYSIPFQMSFQRIYEWLHSHWI